MRRRPMVGAAVALSVGILTACAGWLSLEQAGLFAGLVLFYGLGCLVLRKPVPSGLVFTLLALIGALRFFSTAPQHNPDHVQHLQSKLPLRDREVVLTVQSAPEYRAYRSRSGGFLLFTAKCRHLREADGWRRLTGLVEVRIFDAPPSLSLPVGRRLQATGTFERRTWPGDTALQFDISDPADLEILGGRRLTWAPAVTAWQQWASGRLQAGMEGRPVERSILHALVLGQRKEVPREIMECFRRTGSVHIFAISGLHVGIIGLFLMLLLKSFGVPRDRFGLWLIPLLFFYIASTGMKSSALRALLMAAVFLLAPLFRRQPDIPTSVAFAGLVLMLIDPMVLLSAGFIYSFVVVTFIVMVFARVPRRWLEGGPVRVYVVSLCITSFAAGLASIPLTALYFGTFSPIAFVGNLLVVPLTFLIVLCGWLSILLPPVSVVFNHAAAFFVSLMLQAVEGLDRIPGSCISVEPPPLAAVLLWYIGLICFFTHASHRRHQYLALAGTACSVLWCVLR